MSDHAERECEALFGSPYERIAELERELAAARKERDEALAAKQIMLSALNRSTETLNTASAGLAERDAFAAALDNLGQYRAVTGCIDDDARLLIAYNGDPDIAGVIFDPTYDPWEAFEQFEKFLHDKVDKTNAKAILTAHDAAKDGEIAALVDALRDTLGELMAVTASAALAGLPARVWAGFGGKARAALAPYRCRTCDGSHEVFDDPSAPCPACASGKVEVKDAV